MTTATLRVRNGWRPGADLFDKVHIDYFAGGGGVAMGYESGTHRAFDLAVNHCPEAIAMHAANHPGTKHLTEDVFNVNLEDHLDGRAVGFLWASPDCRHFSRAKGATPVQGKIRGLAWIVVRVARRQRPDVIMLENVREFLEWGPLQHKAVDGGYLWMWVRVNRHKGKLGKFHRAPIVGPKDTDRGVIAFIAKHKLPGFKLVAAMEPIPERKGETFKKWCAQLRAAGYVIEWNVLNAADYGAPTSRKRLFVIARCDGKPIVWPKPTHGPKCKKPWRTAAECIDWTIPCPSIFSRKRDLRAKTCRRIALGICRFVLGSDDPYIVPEGAFSMPINHGDGWKNAGRRDRSINRPAPSLTASRGEYLVTPTMATVGWGERSGQAPRCQSIEQPLGTIPAGGGKQAIVGAVVKNYGGVVGHDVHRPLGTITAKDHHSAMTAYLTQISQQGANGLLARDARTPLPSIVSKQEHCLTTAYIVKLYGTGIAEDCNAPASTLTGQGRKHAITQVMLMRYYSSGGQNSAANKPCPAVTTKGRLAAVTTTDRPVCDVWSGEDIGKAIIVGAFLKEHAGDAVKPYLADVVLEGVVIGQVAVATIGKDHYIVVDIGLRMFVPRELASCQGFPRTYILTGTITSQIARIGNSVPPPVVEALTAANLN